MSATEPAGLEAHLAFELGVSTLRDEIRKMRRDMARTVPVAPTDRRENLAGMPSNQVPASGTLVLYCDGPQIGRLWEVRQIVIGGAKVGDAVAGTAQLFVQVAPPNDLSLATCRDLNMTPLPFSRFYSTGQIKIHGRENLWVVITGGTVGQTITAYADINEYPETTKMATTNVE